MNRQQKCAFLALTGLFAGGAGWVTPAHASTFSLYTTSGFVDLLVEKGIIPAGNAKRAHSIATLYTNARSAQNSSMGAKNADKVAVSVSQLIEHANLTYREGTNINGLVLTVNNITDTDTVLEATRHCSVVYRIYSASTLVYTNASSSACTKNEKVSYVLPARATRMFEIRHPHATFPLKSGTYRFQLEYPGYGKGEKTVTILR